MKTADRENPNSRPRLCNEPSNWGGRRETSLLIHRGWKARKFPAVGQVFLLTFPFIELLGRKHGRGIKSAVADLRNVVWHARAGWKYLASRFKDEWAIDDYPIRYRFQPAVEPPKTSRLRPIPWVASVINWPAMSGNGSTKEEASRELREKFDRFKATHEKLPRPGTKVPIEFVKSDRVDQHSELAKDFIQRVLEIEWAWISDESSLWDFHSDETNGKLNDKIRQIYGVDISDIPSGNLADILERISKSHARENLR